MMNPNEWGMRRVAFLACCLVMVTVVAAPAQTFQTLETFDFDDGAYPIGAFAQGTDGNLYGTAFYGGSPDAGVIFRLSGGLLNFGSQGPASPFALLQASDGYFYGTSGYGGNSTSAGTVFRLTKNGTLSTLYSFCSQPTCSDGNYPVSGLVQGADGNLYGTTYYGGSRSCGVQGGCGTIFKITLDGSLTTLHTFSGPDGAAPLYGTLLQASDGDFYGTTSQGGANCTSDEPCGTIFKISSTGGFKTLHSFVRCSQNCTEGEFPAGALVEGSNGLFYGITIGGGIGNCLFGGGCGTVYSITSAGILTTVYSFCGQTNCPDGLYPYAGLVLGTDGNMYGTTTEGGTCTDCYGLGGTIFSITPEGSFSLLHNFDVTGFAPFGTLVQATSGIFYGTASQGGNFQGSCSGNLTYVGCGTAYSLDMSLGPFVTFSPHAFGKVGQIARIIGQGFTGTTAVAINGVSARFAVVSDTFLTARVPSGTTTGYVTVTTPTGVLTSNVPFHVIQYRAPKPNAPPSRQQ